MSAADTAPFGWAFVTGAILTGFVYAAPLLIARYLTSDFHQRGLARLRRQRQKGAK